jgi:uncharacterized protein (TIRG00374 family)
MTKGHLRGWLVGAAIGVVCLGVTLSKVNIGESWKTLGHVKRNWVFVLAAISVANLALRGWRWQRIIPSRSRPDLWRCVRVLAIGTMGNNLLPARAGDLARCTLIGRKLSAKESSEALATLGVEKIMDGLGLVSIVLYSLWILAPPRWLWQLGAVGGLIFGSALLLLLALRFWVNDVAATIAALGTHLKLPGLASNVIGLLRSFASALREINTGWQVTSLVAMTAAIWFTEAVLVWIVASSVNVPVTATIAVVVSAVIGLGFMIPAAPAGLGTYEAFGVAAFKLVGIAASKGLAVTLLIHGWVFLSNSALGFLSLATVGWSFSQLRRREDVGETLRGRATL